MAQALLAEGVAPTDRIAFLDKNSRAFFEVSFGAAKINAVPVPVNWRLAPAEMAVIINDSEAPILFVDQSFADHLAACDRAAHAPHPARDDPAQTSGQGSVT